MSVVWIWLNDISAAQMKKNFEVAIRLQGSFQNLLLMMATKVWGIVSPERFCWTLIMWSVLFVMTSLLLDLSMNQTVSA